MDTSLRLCELKIEHLVLPPQESPLGALLPTLASSLTLLVDKYGSKFQVQRALRGKRYT